MMMVTGLLAGRARNFSADSENTRGAIAGLVLVACDEKQGKPVAPRVKLEVLVALVPRNG